MVVGVVDLVVVLQVVGQGRGRERGFVIDQDQVVALANRYGISIVARSEPLAA